MKLTHPHPHLHPEGEETKITLSHSSGRAGVRAKQFRKDGDPWRCA